LEDNTPAHVWRVRWLDQPGEAYYLVIFGELQAAVGVATVDLAGGEVMNWARLPGVGPHLMVDEETALQRASFPPGAQAELVWKSCVGSRSPLYPLWEIQARGRVVYVDQQGKVWQTLESAGLGG
jgi:hypothetical protein